MVALSAAARLFVACNFPLLQCRVCYHLLQGQALKVRQSARICATKSAYICHMDACMASMLRFPLLCNTTGAS